MTRFTFNFYLDIRKPLKSGLYSIKVNMYDGKEKKTTNFTIKKVDGIEISATKKDWLDIWVNKDKKNSFDEVVGETTVYGRKNEIRTILKAKKDILNDIIATEGINSSASIKDAFYNYRLPTSFTDDVYTEFSRKIDELNQAERYKSAKTYITTLNNLRKYNHNQDFTFSKVTVVWLDGYERSRSKKGLTTDSIALDMRNIRSIYNRVKKNDQYLIENYPFGKKEDGKYSIKKGTSKNQSLTKEELKKIIEFSSDNPKLQRARDIFLFSFYVGGMNFKDIILLTPKNIEDGYFIRAKTKFTTKREIQIPIEFINQEHKEIVERYKGKGKYLFNFLPDNATELDIFNCQRLEIRQLDTWIKKLAVELDLNHKLSYLWARHTFATIMHKNKKVSPKSTQVSMGHSTLAMTNSYVASTLTEERADINKALNLEDD